ncbi:MAG: sulfate ABC transporter permease, partial [Clostridium sp.]
MNKNVNNSESNLVKWGLIISGVIFLILMLGFPLVIVLVEGLREGISAYTAAITDEYALKAIKLTLIATVIATIFNTIFGVLAAWAITKFKFRGKNLLITLIDLPFAISPIIAGLVFVLTFGRGGLFEPLLAGSNIKIIFAIPGIVLATLFVTFPFIVRELIPLMNAQG